MGFWRSVRFKIVVGVVLVIAPMAAFLVYNNLYAMKVAREQISGSYDKLLAEQAGTRDRMLTSYFEYLNRLEREPEMQALQVLPPESDDYTLAKLGMRNRLTVDLETYDRIDTIFVYPYKERDAFFATEYSFNLSDKRAAILRWAEDHKFRLSSLPGKSWETMSINDVPYLFKAVSVGKEMMAGILIRVSEFGDIVANFDVGSDGAAVVMDSRGNLLTGSPFVPLADPGFRRRVSEVSGVQTGIRYGGQSYMIISRPSSIADTRFVLVTTEKHMLQNLPFFQKVLYYWIPLSIVGVLTLYLAFLQRVVFQPLLRLVRGMRKLGQGQFDVRLPEVADSSEFAFMTSTFNQMVRQIEKLKIDVYEEQIRLQKAEYRQLQVQINPHFYMNSLNIIYSLAALQDYKTVQKMSLHLAEYFRFLMLGHRGVVRLEDEIRHIGHYLEIQKLRFVSKLDYKIEVDAKHLNREISPLLLQPFVENSVIHGFNGRTDTEEIFRIEIRSAEDPEQPGRYARLTIADNGPGFPEKMIAGSAVELYEAGAGEQHLGIWNVLRRFGMLYGGDGSIRFRNDPAGGAVVEVRLPLSGAEASRFAESG